MALFVKLGKFHTFALPLPAGKPASGAPNRRGSFTQSALCVRP
jgi:hypothetical protein